MSPSDTQSMIALVVLGTLAVLVVLLRTHRRNGIGAQTDPPRPHEDFDPDQIETASDLETESETAEAPMRVYDWTVHCGTRTHIRFDRPDVARRRVVEEVTVGFVALDQRDVPKALHLPWRLPPTSDTRAASRLVRAMWAQLNVHLDHRVEIHLDDPPSTLPEASRLAARRLIVGARALGQTEEALVEWLAAAPDRAAPGSSGSGLSGPGHAAPAARIPEARADRVWRTDLLFTWFSGNPLALAAAERERDAGEPELRALAAIVRRDLEALRAVSQDEGVSADLRRRALLTGVEIALDSRNFDEISATLPHAIQALSASAEVASLLLDRTDPQVAADQAVVPLLESLFTVLANDEALSPALFRRIEAFGGTDATRERALCCKVAAVRGHAAQALEVSLGAPSLAALCVTLLERIASRGGGGDPLFEDDDTAVALLGPLGRLGTARELPAIRVWSDALSWDGQPSVSIREAAAAAIAAIVARQPRGLEGGISLVEGEVGGISEAPPAGST